MAKGKGDLFGGGILSALPIGTPLPQSPQMKDPMYDKMQCEAKGGTWDSANLKCIMPVKPPVETPSNAPGTTEVFNSSENGRLSGASIPGQGKYQIPTGKKLPGGQQEMRPASIEEYNAYRQSLGLAPTANTETYLGLNSQDVNSITQDQQSKVMGGGTGQPGSVNPIGTAQQQREALIQQQNMQQAQVDTFNTQMPGMTELSPQSQDSGIPILGTLADIATALVGNSIIGKDGKYQKIAPERLRSDALTQIEKDVYARGIDNHAKFGAVIEAIPLAGTLVNRYARGLIDTPGGNVEDMRKIIVKKKKEIIQLTKDAKLSPAIKMQSQDNLNQIEEDIQELESRMKLLTIYSAELRAQPEQVDLIEQDVYNTKRYLLSAKIAIANGQELASDEDILQALQ